MISNSSAVEVGNASAIGRAPWRWAIEKLANSTSVTGPTSSVIGNTANSAPIRYTPSALLPTAGPITNGSHRSHTTAATLAAQVQSENAISSREPLRDRRGR